MKTPIMVLVMTAAILLGPACSRNARPSESEAEALLRNLVKEESRTALSLISFKKTDGIASVHDGVATYDMNFLVTIRFEENCIWLEASILPASGFKVARKQATGTGAGWDNFLYKATNPGIEGKPGATFDVTGYLTAEKSERGWRLTGIRLTNVQSSSAPRSDVASSNSSTANKTAPAPSATTATSAPHFGEPFTLPGTGLEFVPIPSGEFTMGSPDTEKGRFSDEGQHRVKISRPYWMAKFEVTSRLMAHFFESGPGEPLPLDEVGKHGNAWSDEWGRAQALCQLITERERVAGRLPKGYIYTLPTEAQWEYACRAGTTGPYAGDLDSMADYLSEKLLAKMSTDLNTNLKLIPVGSFQPNKWGLYDMHGGAKEWCLDFYGPYPTAPAVDPTGPESGDLKVIRGGGTASLAARCRSAARESGSFGPFVDISRPLPAKAGIRLVLSFAAPPVQPDTSAKVNASLSAAGERRIEITIGDDRVFSVARLEGIVGEKITLRLTDTGTGSGNPAFLVLLEKGTNIGAFIKTTQGKTFTPGAIPKEVIAYTKTLGPRESDEIAFQLPSEPGEYPFIDGFSLGFIQTKGVFVVSARGQK